jgi:hypothetical protein
VDAGPKTRIAHPNKPLWLHQPDAWRKVRRSKQALDQRLIQRVAAKVTHIAPRRHQAVHGVDFLLREITHSCLARSLVGVIAPAEAADHCTSQSRLEDKRPTPPVAPTRSLLTGLDGASLSSAHSARVQVLVRRLRRRVKRETGGADEAIPVLPPQR